MHTWGKEYLEQREKKTINHDKNTWILSGKVKQGMFEKMVDSTKVSKKGKK